MEVKPEIEETFIDINKDKRLNTDTHIFISQY